MKQVSILGLVLTAVSALTAAIVPTKKVPITFNGVQVRASNATNCQIVSGTKDCQTYVTITGQNDTGQNTARTTIVE